MRILLILILTLSLSAQAQPTLKVIYDYCLEAGIENAEIVTAQTALETQWLECTNCCLDHNNIFGFMLNGSCKEYDSWQECVHYYKRWQDKWYLGNRDYYEFLTCITLRTNGDCMPYSEHPEKYIKDLRWIVNKIKSELGL